MPFLLILFYGVLPDHLVLHSLIGAVTVGTIISIFMTIYLYPSLTSLLFHLDKAKLKEKCRFSPSLVLSCMLGNLFHIFLDIPMHPFNPVLWPFVDPYSIVGILVQAFTAEGDIARGFLHARILVNIFMITIMGMLIAIIIVKNRKNLWERLLIGKSL